MVDRRDDHVGVPEEAAVQEFVASFRKYYGPTMNAFAAAAQNGKEADLQRELETLFERQNKSATEGAGPVSLPVHERPTLAARSARAASPALSATIARRCANALRPACKVNATSASARLGFSSQASARRSTARASAASLRADTNKA